MVSELLKTILRDCEKARLAAKAAQEREEEAISQRSLAWNHVHELEGQLYTRAVAEWGMPFEPRVVQTEDGAFLLRLDYNTDTAIRPRLVMVENDG